MSAPTPAIGTLPARAVDDIIADIMKAEFSLDAEHCLLGNMRYKIPPDQKLFVVVFDDMGPPFGACTFLDIDETSPTYGLEVQQSTVLHTVRVETMGFIDDDGYDVAKDTAPKVTHALGGFLAQQAMGKYRLQIGRAQAPINATDTEETARLVKYVSRVNITALHQTAKAPPAGADYFDKFNGATVNGSANAPEVITQ
jgi:hypothetical protein